MAVFLLWPVRLVRIEKGDVFCLFQELCLLTDPACVRLFFILSSGDCFPGHLPAAGSPESGLPGKDPPGHPGTAPPETDFPETVLPAPDRTDLRILQIQDTTTGRPIRPSRIYSLFFLQFSSYSFSRSSCHSACADHAFLVSTRHKWHRQYFRHIYGICGDPQPQALC